MNFDDTLKQMLSSAAAAAKVHWNDFRSYAEQEFKRLDEAGAQVEADYAADAAAAQLPQNATKREKLMQKARLRAELAFDNLRLAADGVLTSTTADAEIAGQDAINASLVALRAAVYQELGNALRVLE